MSSTRIFPECRRLFCSCNFQEYSEDSNSEPDVDLENQYYNSKALKEFTPKEALQSFQKVLDLENNEKGEWGFKALKQMIKINFKLVRLGGHILQLLANSFISEQLRRDDESIQAAPDLHKERSDSKPLGEVYQLDLRLHINFQERKTFTNLTISA